MGVCLQGQDGHIYEFAPKEAVSLPAGQLSVLTLPRFLAIPSDWAKETSLESLSGGPAALPRWQILQLSSDAADEEAASQIKVARLISGTALTPC